MAKLRTPEAAEPLIWAEIYAHREQVIPNDGHALVVDDILACWLDPSITSVRRHERGLREYIDRYCRMVEGHAGTTGELTTAWRVHINALAGDVDPPISRRYHTDDLATRAGVSPGTIRGYRRRQQMPPQDGTVIQKGHARPYWRPQTVDRWLESRPGSGRRRTLAVLIDGGEGYGPYEVSARPQSAPFGTWAVGIRKADKLDWKGLVTADCDEPEPVIAMVVSWAAELTSDPKPYLTAGQDLIVQHLSTLDIAGLGQVTGQIDSTVRAAGPLIAELRKDSYGLRRWCQDHTGYGTTPWQLDNL
ncbi:helix-turn-helix transcriptional regulator [Plantactinospora sp. CA-290183]|uniref:helix-turn-helix transcriptional regulator n=1 Tax=Plantactinospora sp. CA-290183 TaxID=3240006 RepID=UPI003D8D32CD